MAEGDCLRRLGPADLVAYRALMLQAYAQAPEAFTSSVAERSGLPLSWWLGRLQEGADVAERVLGVIRGAELVGVAGLSIETRERTRHKATLFGMYVAPAARGQGLARALVQGALALARATAGVELVQLTVSASNTAALALYTGCGFTVFGTEPMAVKLGSGYIDKVHMWVRLDRAPWA